MSDAMEKLGTGSHRMVSRRRRWSEAQKRRIVAESYWSGDSVSVVARRNDVNPSVLFTWRRRFREPADSAEGFVPVVVDGPGEASGAKKLARHGEVDCGVAPARGRIEIALDGGVRVIVDATVHAPALARVLAVVERRWGGGGQRCAG